MKRWTRGTWKRAGEWKARIGTRGTWKWAAGLAVAGALAIGVVARGDDSDPQLWRAAEESRTATAGSSSGDGAGSAPVSDQGSISGEGQSNGDAPATEATDAGEPSSPPALPEETPVSAAARAVGTDAEYVRGICLALAEFYRDVDAAMLAINPGNPSGIAQEFANGFWPVLVRFKEDLNQIAPPADLVTWHDTMAAELGHAAERIFAGQGLSEIVRLGDRPLPDFPAEAQARLAAAAAATPECRAYEDSF